MFQGQFGDFRIDVFTPSIDFSWEALRTRQQVKSGGGTSHVAVRNWHTWSVEREARRVQVARSLAFAVPGA